MSTAYQKELCEIREYCDSASCLRTNNFKVRGIRIDVHSGIYDGEFIAYAAFPTKYFPEEALTKFVVTKNPHMSDYVYVYSRNIKSLKDIIRRTMKESV